MREQRALPAAARSHDGHRLPGPKEEVHTVQHALAARVFHHQLPGLEQDGGAHIVCPMSVVGSARAARSPGMTAPASTTASVTATIEPITLASGQTPSAGCTFDTTPTQDGGARDRSDDRSGAAKQRRLAQHVRQDRARSEPQGPENRIVGRALADRAPEREKDDRRRQGRHDARQRVCDEPEGSGGGDGARPRGAEREHPEVLQDTGGRCLDLLGPERGRDLQQGKADLSRPLPEALHHGQRRIDVGGRRVGVAGEQAHDLESVPALEEPDGIAELQVAALGEAAVHQRLGRARPGAAPLHDGEQGAQLIGLRIRETAEKKGNRVGLVHERSEEEIVAPDHARPPELPHGAVRGRRHRASWCSCRRRSDIAARTARASGSIAPPGARRRCG